MDIIYDALFYLIQAIHSGLEALGLTGSYGLAIILMTVGIRLLLWPLNTTQTRSMQKMQELQPKLKALQDRFKDNPQKMQQEMMAFYAANKFNPFAGCLPMIVQLPIFIGLYGMLISPNFLAVAGQEQFLFIDNLSRTLVSHAGPSLDHTLNVDTNDKFVTQSTIDVTFESGTTTSYPVRDTRKVLQINPSPLIPGDAMTVTLDAKYLGQDGFPEAFVKRIKTAEMVVVNDTTKEVERLTFTPQAPQTVVNGGAAETTTPEAEAAPNPTDLSWRLADTVPTIVGETSFNMGMVALIALYGVLTVLYQRLMSGNNPAASGPQAQLMKLMPLMFVGVLFFIPIPAGVLLYLLATMLMMFLQTVWVKWQDDKEKANNAPSASRQVVDINASKA